jgi:hypothetical protein
MRFRPELLFRFKARGPAQVLEALAKSGRARSNIDELARVTVLTHAGAIEGCVLDVAQDRPALLLLRGEHADVRAAYLDMADVIAVEVHDLARLAPALGDGEITRPLDQPPPTRLELKRRVADVAGRLGIEVIVEWDGMPDDEIAAFNLADLAQALQQGVSSSTEDVAGREAWRAIRCVQLAHQASAQLGASRSNSTIRMTCDLRRKLPVPLDRAVQSALDATL